MYSQNKEEEVILQVFEGVDNGQFLDIGAFDPFKFSNTRALFERGWGGVLVEPGVPQLANLHKEYDGCDRIQICDKAIAEVSGELTFYVTDYCNALSTLCVDHLNKWHTAKFVETKVQAITPNMLFELYGKDFDFISLDVESNNWQIAQLINWNEFPKLKLICIEYDTHFQEMVNFFKKHSFELIDKNAENMLLKKSR